jgi:hypothetical protein
MRVMRRLLVCALVLALATVAQAAGGPVVEATERTAAARSATIAMSMTMAAPGQARTTLIGTGAQRGSSAKMSMRIRAGGISTRMDVILLREDGSYAMYMRSPLFQAQLPRGRSWVRVDLSASAASLGLDFSSLIGVSETLAPLEAGLVSTRRIGREVVAGASTTRYRAVIDLRRAARAVPAYAQQVRALERRLGVRLGRVPYDVWIGSDGRFRRLRSTMRAGAATSVQTITYRAFNVPVSIAAPPRARVFSP